MRRSAGHPPTGCSRKSTISKPPRRTAPRREDPQWIVHSGRAKCCMIRDGRIGLGPYSSEQPRVGIRGIPWRSVRLTELGFDTDRSRTHYVLAAVCQYGRCRSGATHRDIADTRLPTEHGRPVRSSSSARRLGHWTNHWCHWVSVRRPPCGEYRAYGAANGPPKCCGTAAHTYQPAFLVLVCRRLLPEPPPIASKANPDTTISPSRTSGPTSAPG